MASNLIIRADASAQIGSGHLMRCFALACQWQNTGGKATCVGFCDNENLKRRFANRGIPFIPLEAPHPDARDLRTLKSMIHNLHTAPWVVLDGYHLDSDYQRAISSAGAQILVIDDLIHHKIYCAHVILNQNAGAESLVYPGLPYTKCLLGPTYALLRPEFLKWEKWIRKQPHEAHKVLVTLGGGDTENVTLKVLQAMAQIREHDLEIRVVVGPSNPHLVSLQQVARRADCDIQFLDNVSDMAAEMTWADVAISAGGSTCWELAFMRLPTLIITLADNQVLGAQALHHRGAAVHLGWHRDLRAPRIASALTEILKNRRRRAEMSKNGRGIIDGRGASRILETMQAYDTCA